MFDTDLDLAGIEPQQHKIITCEIEGIVDEDDLRALIAGTPLPGDEQAVAARTPEAVVIELDDPTNIQKIREKWHHVARLVSKGLTNRLIATMSGYTEGYLSILLNQPAMIELVELYRIQNGAAAEVITENLRKVGTAALEQLGEKIEKRELSVDQLIQTSKLGLDRSGHGPSSSTHTTTDVHLIDHAALQDQMKRARSGSREFIVSRAEVQAAFRPALTIDNVEEDAA